MTISAVHFDIPLAIQTAWDVLWADNLKQRAKAKKDKSQYWANRTYYLCSADIERQVRSFAQDSKDGRPWSRERSWSGGYGSGIRFPGNLQNTIRAWLFAQVREGKLAVHNFNRGHISGARFRPAADPIGPTEQSTIAKKERNRDRPRLWHFATRYGGRAECTKSRKMSGFSRHRSKTLTTKDMSKVTCPRCQKLLGGSKTGRVVSSTPHYEEVEVAAAK